MRNAEGISHEHQSYTRLQTTLYHSSKFWAALLCNEICKINQCITSHLSEGPL